MTHNSNSRKASREIDRQRKIVLLVAFGIPSKPRAVSTIFRTQDCVKLPSASNYREVSRRSLQRPQGHRSDLEGTRACLCQDVPSKQTWPLALQSSYEQVSCTMPGGCSNLHHSMLAPHTSQAPLTMHGILWSQHQMLTCSELQYSTTPRCTPKACINMSTMQQVQGAKDSWRWHVRECLEGPQSRDQ